MAEPARLPLTADARGATRLELVRREEFDSWLGRRPLDERAWLRRSGLRAEAGAVAILPGRAARAVAVVDFEDPGGGAPVWALAGLPQRLPEGSYRLVTRTDRATATALALGWALGGYAYARYRRRKRAPARLVWPAGADRAEVERLAGAVWLARDLVNTPASDLGPEELAAAARRVARTHGAACEIIAGDALLRRNYPAIHAVGRASARAPRLIDLRWGDARAPKVTLIGKGVCFDSGGLDIKTASGMLLMKKDMGGAAIALALASVLMAAKTRIRLRVLVPAVENAVAGNALRPLDVITTRSGKTVEIGNTDAEGRLILCDALYEADRESPDLLVDCATLTGAARTALGPEVQPFFTRHDPLAAAFSAAGEATGDPVWRLPLWAGYRRQIDGKVADLNNVSASPHAGAIVAALYLAEFVRPETPWLHVDLFAWNATARPGRPEGGEATALRALHRLIVDRYA